MPVHDNHCLYVAVRWMTMTQDNLPQCPARLFYRDDMLCRHPRVRSAGNIVSPVICQGCDHINEPATLRDIEQTKLEATESHKQSAALDAKNATFKITTEKPCQHRGLTVLRYEPSQLCGSCQSEAVYTCAIYEECTIHPYKGGNKPARCVGCPHGPYAMPPIGDQSEAL